MDQIERLILEVKGQENVAALTAELVKEKESLTDLATQFRTGAISQQQFDASARTTAQNIVNLNGQLKSWSNLSRENQLRILELGRATQDFAQGGVAGILNNIERLVGGAGPLAGILTLAGTAAYVAAPHIKSFFSTLIEGSNEVPRSKGNLEAWKDELKEANKTLDDLRDKHVLTNKELAQFNDLTARAADLQEKLTAAKRREAEFEKARQHKSDEEKKTADMVAELVGPDIDKVRGEARGGVTAMGAESGALGKINARLRARLRGQAENQARDPHDLSGVAGLIQKEIDDLRGEAEAERQRLADEADRMVEGALSGKAGGLEGLINVLPKGSRFRRDLSDITPEARRRQDAEMEDDRAPGTEAFGRRLHEAGVRQRKAAKKAEELNREGQRNAGAMHALQDRQKEKARQELLARERKQKHDVAQDQRLGREVGQRFAKQGPLAALPDGKLLHASPMQPGPLNARMAMEIARNQQILAQNQAADLEALRRLGAVGREARRQNQQRRQPALNNGW